VFFYFFKTVLFEYAMNEQKVFSQSITSIERERY